ncbi:hypothetical protein [Sphingomonas sp. VNH70]|uniref:hypothetical protein n=1 Tax=Sphingomonas silueang TaxID=3156617 RepID=UPI0032B4AE97
MILLALLAAQAPVLAVPPPVFADAEVLGGDPRLVWKPGTAIAVEDGGGELVVRFDQPLPEAAIDAFRRAAGPAIGDLRWNDDSLVLRAAAGYDLRWRQSGATLTVSFVRRADDIVVEARAAPDLDAELLAIEADVAAGYPGEGRRRAEALAVAYPNDRRVRRILADARGVDGDVAGAAETYRAIGATDRTARRALAVAPGTAAAGVTLRGGGDLQQAEAVARADVRASDALTLGGGARVVASRVETPAGTRERAEPILDAAATVRVGDDTQVQAVLAAALDSGVTGGGVRITAGPAERQWRAALLLRQPDYSTVEQALGGGTLSRLAGGLTYRLAPGLVGQFDLGANRYGLARIGGGSDTLTLAAGLDYIRRTGALALGLTYRLEAEYVQSRDRTPGGTAIVDLIDRENHTLQALASGAIGTAQLTGLAGWTVDRFGGDGPNASLGLDLPVGTLWRIEASGGISSIARPGFPGQQLFARAFVTRGLGSGR